jgi:hypothetical protein
METRLSGTDSMLRFQVERRDDGTKRYRKMKWRQQARLSSMGRKRIYGAAVCRHRPEDMQHQEGNNASWPDTNLTGLRNEENTRGGFIYYKWMVKI